MKYFSLEAKFEFKGIFKMLFTSGWNFLKIGKFSLK